jgi:hypothetical protein
MSKIITPDMVAKEMANKMMTPEQKIEILEKRFEMLKANAYTTLEYIRASISKANYNYADDFKKIVETLEKEGLKHDESGNFVFPESIEKNITTHVKLMWLIANNIMIIRNI